MIDLKPVGTAWQRRATLSTYLVGCPNALANVITQERDHLFKIANHEYLSFANAEDRRRYTLAKLKRDAYRFLPIAFLADTIMVRQDLVLSAVHGDMKPEDRKRSINFLIESSGSWKILYRACVERFGYQVLLGGLDQMGCPWEETETNPQLTFRIAAGLIDYMRDEKPNTRNMPIT